MLAVFLSKQCEDCWLALTHVSVCGSSPPRSCRWATWPTWLPRHSIPLDISLVFFFLPDFSQLFFPLHICDVTNIKCTITEVNVMWLPRRSILLDKSLVVFSPTIRQISMVRRLEREIGSTFSYAHVKCEFCFPWTYQIQIWCTGCFFNLVLPWFCR